MNLDDYAWLVQVAYLLIPVLVAVAFQRLYPMLRAKYLASTSAEQRRVIEGVARTVVLAVEGYMATASGQAKYEEAERKLNDILAARHIPTTVAETRAVIEAAVYNELNRDKAKVQSKVQRLDNSDILR